jgi:putative tryptophan/tyrosine transport system substrate-binding protein
MRRREFIAGLGSAAGWPLVARAQQGEQMRRIGMLMPYGGVDDPMARLTVFRQALEQLGWSEGRNVHIDYRFAAGSIDQCRLLAQELLALQPDVGRDNSNRSRIAAGNAGDPDRVHRCV